MKHKHLLRPFVGGALLLVLALPVGAQPGNRGPRGRGDGPPRDGRGGPNRGPRAKGELNRIWHDIADLEGTRLALDKAQAAKVVALVLPVSKNSALSDAAAKTLADKIGAVLTAAQNTEINQDRPRDGRGGPRPDGDGPPPRDGRGGPRPDGDGPPPPRDGRGGPRPDGDGDGPPPRDGRDGPRDGDGRGPRGDGPPPRMDRADFEKVRPFMDALNPFYPPTGYDGFKALPTEFAKDVAKRYGERRALLETLSNRAKGK